MASNIWVNNDYDDDDDRSVELVPMAGIPPTLLESPFPDPDLVIDELESTESEHIPPEHIPEIRMDGILRKLSDVQADIVSNSHELFKIFAASVYVRNLQYSAEVLRTHHPISNVMTSIRERIGLEQVIVEEKILLDGINYYIEPKMFVLVMGAPGSGRTTLLNLLADRVGRGRAEGQIFFDGKPIDPHLHHRRVAYVWSADNIHIASLTVEETFRIALKLQVDLNMLKERVRLGEKMNGVEDLLLIYRDITTQILRLSHRNATLVGDDLLRGLSGGEKRRCTIGIELLKFPQLLIADEFTTGLDSAMCVELGHFFRYLAFHRIPVIASALQPPLGLYESFTHILLLQRGRLAYFGKRKQVLGYFARLGYTKPPGLNPADFLPDLLEHPSKYNPQSPPQVDFATIWKDSQEARGVEGHIDCAIAKINNSDIKNHSDNGLLGGSSHTLNSESNIPNHSGSDWESAVPPDVARFTTSRWTQYKALVWRGARSLRHVPTPVIFKVILSLVFGLFYGTVFWQLGHTQADLSLRQSLCFNIVMVICMKAAEASAIEFSERTVVNWQRKMKYYGILPYMLAGLTIQMPTVSIDITVLGTLAYWIGNLHPSAECFIYLLLASFVMTLVIFACVRSIAAASPTFPIAQQFVPFTLMIMLVFGGFYILPGSIPDYLIWMYWISPFQWVYVGLVTNELSNTAFHCTNAELMPPLSQLPAGAVQTCPFTTGEAFLDSQGFPQVSGWKWVCLAVLIGYAVAFNLLCYLIYRYPCRKPRRRRIADNPDEALSMVSLPSDAPQSEIPSQGVWLQFDNVCYSVDLEGSCFKGKSADSRMQLLNGVSGYAGPGMAVALMGSSGAGKSTLLDVIANRKTGGHITGEIAFNGVNSNAYLHRFSGYCEQQSLHFTATTVREAVEFAAYCRLDRSISPSTKRRFAKRILLSLKLQDVSQLMVSELSLETLKRLTLAVELASNCPLLFLDEPTSGLDSIGALHVMTAVKEQAQAGRTVVCTIHQPSSQVFSLFTHILLLKRGGRVVYFGETSKMADYFARNCGRHLQDGENLADFALACLEPVTEGGPDPADIWQQQAEAAQVREFIKNGVNPQTLPFRPDAFGHAGAFSSQPQGSSPVVELQPAQVAEYDNFFAISYLAQWRALMQRALISYWRDPFGVRVKFYKMIIFGLLIGALFWQFGEAADDHRYDQKSWRLRVSVFFISLQMFALNAFDQIPTLITPRAAYYRERSSGTYSAVTYTFTVVISEALPIVITTVAYVIPVYWMSGLKVDAGNFFIFLLFSYIAAITCLAFAQFIAIMAPTTEMAAFIAGLPSMAFTVLAGFLIPKPDIPDWWIWGYYLSYVNYGLQALMINEIKGLNFTCPHNHGAIPFTYVNSTNIGYYCPITSGDQIFSEFGIESSFLWPCLGILIGFFTFFGFLSFIGLKFVNHMSR